MRQPQIILLRLIVKNARHNQENETFIGSDHNFE